MNWTLQDDIWIKVADEAFEAQKMRKYYEKLEDALLEKLKRLSNNQNSFGSIYRFSQYERSGTIDYKAIPELQTVDLELYRKAPVISWKLTNDNIIL